MVLISSLINIKISPNLQVTKAAISNFKYHLIIMIHQCTSACDVWYCIFIDLQLIFQLVVFHDRLWPMYGNYKYVFCGKKYGSPSAPYEKKIFIWRSPDRILVIGLYGFDANIVIEIFYNNRLIQLLPNKIFWLKKGIRALKFGDFFFKIFDSV